MRKFPLPYAALTALLLNVLWVPGALAGEPAWLQPAALRKALCRQGPCFISLLKDVGRQPDGRRVAVVAAERCTAATEEKYRERDRDVLCPVAYFRVVHDARRVFETALITVDAGADPESGYGAGGGSEEVEWGSDILIHNVQGGSGPFRWDQISQYTLLPFLRLLWQRDYRWNRMDPDDTLSRDIDWRRLVAQVGGNDVAEYSVIPFMEKAPSFSWQRSPLPDYLELRTDGKAGYRSAAYIIGKPKHLSGVKIGPARLRAVWIKSNQLLVEMRDLPSARPGQSILLRPHVEFWWQDVGSFRCMSLLTAKNRDCQALTRERCITHDTSVDETLKNPLYQVLVDAETAALHAGYGKPPPDHLRVQKAGNRLLFTLPPLCCGLSDDPSKSDSKSLGYTLVLSIPVHGRQRLVASSDLRYGKVGTLGLNQPQVSLAKVPRFGYMHLELSDWWHWRPPMKKR